MMSTSFAAPLIPNRHGFLKRETCHNSSVSSHRKTSFPYLPFPLPINPKSSIATQSTHCGNITLSTSPADESLPTSILPLPLPVINRIASGEVISSVFCIVRELVENAIDANSTEISIDFNLDSLIPSIKVIDNGDGIPKKYLSLVASRHTTSKIHTINELETLSTLGFRGQALWALSEILTEVLNVSSRQDTSEGYSVNAGESNIINIAMNKGTIVEANGIPKEWISSQYKIQKIVKECRKYLFHLALVYPNISLKFTSTKQSSKLLWQRSINGLSASQNIGNFTFARELGIPKSYILNKDSTFENDNISISIMLTSPIILSKKKKLFITSLNGRVVKLHSMQKLCQSALGILLKDRDKGGISIFVNISIPSNWINWNITPDKSKILFRYDSSDTEERLARYTSSMVSELLQPHNTWVQNNDNDNYENNISSSYIGQLLKKSNSKETQNNDSNSNDSIISQNITGDIKVVAQLLCTYILVEHTGGLILIEQHVADERIIYEELLKSWSEQVFVPLRQPIPLKYSSHSDIETCAFRLSHLGFNLDLDSHKSTIIVSSVPQVMISHVDQEILLVHLIKWIGEFDGSINDAAAQTSCRMAVKNGQLLSNKEMKDIVSKLLKCNNGHVCPHGRPIFQQLGTKELAKLFGRTWSPERFESNDSNGYFLNDKVGIGNSFYGIIDER